MVIMFPKKWVFEMKQILLWYISASNFITSLNILTENKHTTEKYSLYRKVKPFDTRCIIGQIAYLA